MISLVSQTATLKAAVHLKRELGEEEEMIGNLEIWMPTNFGIDRIKSFLLNVTQIDKLHDRKVLFF